MVEWVEWSNGLEEWNGRLGSIIEWLEWIELNGRMG
jgi:hypothetical protein